MDRRNFITAAGALALNAALLRADEVSDRAAVAIAIHNATKVLASAPVTPEKPKASLPVVTMYSATWCGPCRQAKAELKAVVLPFELQIVDVSKGGQPAWCESLPGFGWEHNGQTRFILGYPGVKQLVARWEATLKEKRQPVQINVNGYEPRWSWPGALARHLSTAHHVNIAGMSQDRMEYLHDALHEGRYVGA